MGVSEQRFAAKYSARSAASIVTILVVSLLACVPKCVADDNTLQLKAIDVYGTDKIDAREISEVFAAEFEQLAQAVSGRDFETAGRIKKQLSAALESYGPFALLNISDLRYYPPNAGLYITIDVVEQDEAASRMPFRMNPAPVTYGDASGLFQTWDEYQQLLTQIALSGDLVHGGCEVLHCIAPFGKNPKLQPYLPVFNEGAAAHESELYDIAANDASSRKRSYAIFLLAHTSNVDRFLALLGEALFDSSSAVRNNAMRVLGEIARNDPNRSFPLTELITAMNFPLTTDRNKAVLAVAFLANSDRYRGEISVSSAPSIALKLLRLDQPNNHDSAYFLLTTLSGNKYDSRDYYAWEEWVASRN